MGVYSGIEDYWRYMSDRIRSRGEREASMGEADERTGSDRGGVWELDFGSTTWKF